MTSASPSPAAGSLHYTTATNALYAKTSSGFYKLATINTSPSFTSVSQTTDGSTSTIAANGTFVMTAGQNTVITLTGSDADEGQTLAYSAATTTGTQTDVLASLTQGTGGSTNVFTLVPASSGGASPISITFSITDSIDTAQQIAIFTITLEVFNSKYTSLLLHSNAAGKNSTFTDLSNTGHTVTAAGNPTQGSFSPFRASALTQNTDLLEYSVSDFGGSISFDGSGDSLSIAASSDFDLGTADFTIETFIYFDTFGTNFILGQNYFSSVFQTDASKRLQFYSSAAGAYLITATTALQTGNWYHVALVRSGNSFTIYLNGTADGTATSSADAGFNSTNPLTIGAWNNSNGTWKGSISNFRFTKKAVYTGNFTKPAAAISTTQSSGTNISSISGTECKLLLLGQEAKVIDKSQNKNLFLIGNSLGHATTKFSGAFSVFFDGGNSSDYIELDDGTAASDFNLTNSTWTLETWFYKSQATGSRPEAIMGRWDNSNSTAKGWSWQIYGDNSRLIWSADGSANTIYTDTRTVPSNQWVHLALVKNGSTLTSYISGVGSAIHSSDFTIYSTTTKTRIGCVFASGAVSSTTLLRGYLQDLRVRKRAEYTGNFTPHTAPLKG